MADRDIKSLPPANAIYDADNLVLEQGGTAKRLTGFILAGYLRGEFSEEVVRQWLNEHPEATTTVQDGAISIPKLAADTKGLFYHPNLLDNWYFRNPVNQRGQTEYVGSGYTVDRWLLNQWNTTSVECSIVPKGLRVHGDASGSCSTGIIQSVEGVKAGCQVTASVLVTDFTVGSAVYLFIKNSSGVNLKRVSFSAPGLYSVTTTLTDEFSGNLMVEIGQGGSYGGSGNTDFTILAAKLELGSQQTLAHKDADGNWVLNELPDYGEQLRRCQRYALALSKQSGHSVYGNGMINVGQNARIVVPLTVTMRALPVVSTSGTLELIADGTTYQVTSVSVETLSPSAVCLLVKSTALSSSHGAAPALLRSYGGGKGELLLSADL